jgi:hypothetical protein
MVAVVELNASKLRHPPSVRRYSPDCLTALIEASARSQFGIPSITKAWFGHSFVYSRAEGPVTLQSDGNTLDMGFFRNPYASMRLADKLMAYYGLRCSVERHDSFESVLEAVRCALEGGELLISSFGAGFMQGRLYGRWHDDVGHMMTPVRLDFGTGTLSAIENICGAVDIRLEDYARCFEVRRASGLPFVLIRTHRDADAAEKPIRICEVQQDLKASLENLLSEDPGEGLKALRRGVADIRDAVERFDTAMYVNAIWTFPNDRYAFEQNLSHWASAGVAVDTELQELGSFLRKATATWAGLHALLAEPGPERLEEVSAPLSNVVRVEEHIAGILEKFHERMR